MKRKEHSQATEKLQEGDAWEPLLSNETHDHGLCRSGHASHQCEGYQHGKPYDAAIALSQSVTIVLDLTENGVRNALNDCGERGGTSVAELPGTSVLSQCLRGIALADDHLIYLTPRRANKAAYKQLPAE